jgi:hypothetical protein
MLGVMLSFESEVTADLSKEDLCNDSHRIELETWRCFGTKRARIFDTRLFGKRESTDADGV